MCQYGTKDDNLKPKNDNYVSKDINLASKGDSLAHKSFNLAPNRDNLAPKLLTFGEKLSWPKGAKLSPLVNKFSPPSIEWSSLYIPNCNYWSFGYHIDILRYYILTFERHIIIIDIKCHSFIVGCQNVTRFGIKLSSLFAKTSFLGAKMSLLGYNLSHFGVTLSLLCAKSSTLSAKLSTLNAKLSPLGLELTPLSAKLSSLGTKR